MTVRELTEALSHHDPDLKVYGFWDTIQWDVQAVHLHEGRVVLDVSGGDDWEACLSSDWPSQ